MTSRPLRIAYGIGSWLVTVAITLIGLAALTFFIGRVIPIDPALKIVGDKATQAAKTGCPISKLLNTTIEMNAKLEG